MNFEYFVAKKLLKQKRKTFSKPIVSIATAGIALSIAVMLISIGVLQGFKNQIKDKITEHKIKQLEKKGYVVLQPEPELVADNVVEFEGDIVDDEE